MAGKHFTGIDGALYADGAKVGRVNAWSFEATVESLDTTSLGDFAKTAIYGLQSFAGSATIFYYEKDGGQIEGSAMMTDVLRTTATPSEPTHELVLQFENGAATHSVKFKCLLTQVSLTATAGEIVTAEISYQVTGPLQTATFA